MSFLTLLIVSQHHHSEKAPKHKKYVYVSHEVGGKHHTHFHGHFSFDQAKLGKLLKKSLYMRIKDSIIGAEIIILCFVVLILFLLIMQGAIIFGLITRLISSTGDQVDRESLEFTKFEVV